MTTPIRPIFQLGERLTARRLNAAVDYLRDTLRRVLLAPLGPGVATGLELYQPNPREGDASITVKPGIAIDGRGRLLVVPDALSFSLADVQAQMGLLPLIDEEYFSISLAMDDRSSGVDHCSPQGPLVVVEKVKLLFRRLTSGERTSPSRVLDPRTPALAEPWGDLDPTGRSSDDFYVPLGEAKRDGNNLAVASMVGRVGVIPRVSGLRNSLGDLVLVLMRNTDGGDDTPAMAVTAASYFAAPVTFHDAVNFWKDLTFKGTATFQDVVSFQAAAGGPDAQAAVVAQDVGAPPAGRVSPSDPTVFEAAGGTDGASDGAGGVLAVSMAYSGAGSFPTVEHPGFPLAVSSSGSSPVLVPYDGSTFPVGLSAARSNTVGGATHVPVAATGMIKGRVLHTGGSALQVGTELAPIAIAAAQPPTDFPLVPATQGHVVVARTAVAVTASTNIQDVLLWVVSPYQK